MLFSFWYTYLRKLFFFIIHVEGPFFCVLLLLLFLSIYIYIYASVTKIIYIYIYSPAKAPDRVPLKNPKTWKTRLRVLTLRVKLGQNSGKGKLWYPTPGQNCTKLRSKLEGRWQNAPFELIFKQVETRAPLHVFECQLKKSEENIKPEEIIGCERSPNAVTNRPYSGHLLLVVLVLHPSAAKVAPKASSESTAVILLCTSRRRYYQRYFQTFKI